MYLAIDARAVCIIDHSCIPSHPCRAKDFGFPPRNRVSVMEQAGNGMSLYEIGAALCWMIFVMMQSGAFQHVDQSPLIAAIMKAPSSAPSEHSARILSRAASACSEATLSQGSVASSSNDPPPKASSVGRQKAGLAMVGRKRPRG